MFNRLFQAGRSTVLGVSDGDVNPCVCRFVGSGVLVVIVNVLSIAVFLSFIKCENRD
jgi:hypothetical protein